MSHSFDSSPEGSRAELVRFWADQGEEPAFLRRARLVEEAWDRVLMRCGEKRDEMLRWARMRLADLARQIDGDWSRVEPLVAEPRQATALGALYAEWRPRMPEYIVADSRGVRSSGMWATAGNSLAAFVETARRFNAAWDKYLAEVDLTEVNRLRADYNTYYPIEKAAAFDTQDIERLGFEPLATATTEDLRVVYPPVEIPTMR